MDFCVSGGGMGTHCWLPRHKVGARSVDVGRDVGVHNRLQLGVDDGLDLCEDAGLDVRRVVPRGIDVLRAECGRELGSAGKGR